MNQKNTVKTLVGIPENYGVRKPGKPDFPKMTVYDWALPEDQARLNNILTSGHAYHDKTIVHDLGDNDLREISQLFIIVEGVIHGFSEYDGTSWNA